MNGLHLRYRFSVAERRSVSRANAIGASATNWNRGQIQRQNQMGVRSDGGGKLRPISIRNRRRLRYGPAIPPSSALYDAAEWSFYCQTYANAGLKYMVRTFRKIDVNNLRA